jgi:hypothetical protein
MSGKKQKVFDQAGFVKSVGVFCEKVDLLNEDVVLPMDLNLLLSELRSAIKLWEVTIGESVAVGETKNPI